MDVLKKEPILAIYALVVAVLALLRVFGVIDVDTEGEILGILVGLVGAITGRQLVTPTAKAARR